MSSCPETASSRSPSASGCARPTCWRGTGSPHRASSTPGRCWCSTGAAAAAPRAAAPAGVRRAGGSGGTGGSGRRQPHGRRPVTRSAGSRRSTAPRCPRCSPRTGWTGHRSSIRVRPSRSRVPRHPPPLAPAAPLPAARGPDGRRPPLPPGVHAHRRSRATRSSRSRTGTARRLRRCSTRTDSPGPRSSTPARPSRSRARRRSPWPLPGPGSWPPPLRRAAGPAVRRARRGAGRERPPHHRHRPPARGIAARHRDRARHGDGRILDAQPRPGRPRFAGTVPAAPERRLGHRGPGLGCHPRHAGVLRGQRRTRTATSPAGCSTSPGWESMPFTEAAQAVQISAYPDRYGAWEAAAHQWLAALG